MNREQPEKNHDIWQETVLLLNGTLGADPESDSHLTFYITYINYEKKIFSFINVFKLYKTHIAN